MDGLEVSRFGPRALLIDFAEKVSGESLARCRGLLRCLKENPLEGLDDVTPAYCSVLLEFSDSNLISAQLGKLSELLKSAEDLPPEGAALHEIPVCYDGPDIEELAGRNGLSVSDVAELHASPVYSVYLIGFSPGFPYLGPLDSRLHAPRVDSPRSRVPTGSVAIGGEHTGIYSVASPGGWWLIGRTDREIFSVSKAQDAGSEGAFLLRQGDLVKFRAVGDLRNLE